MVHEKITYSGPVDLTQYFIKSYNITNADSNIISSTNGKKGVQIDIIFSRRLLNQVITVFLPCIAICIVAFSTNYYRVIIKMILLSFSKRVEYFRQMNLNQL